MALRRPTAEELRLAVKQTTPDVIGPDLKVLFCGINPGLYSAATGCHFARPGNRFWPALFQAGFTPRLFSPDEQWELLPLGYGVTNLVTRPSAAAAELSAEELLAGGRRLAVKVKKCRPRCLAVLGSSAFRQAFDRPKATIGLQLESLGSTALWVLPNPSGLNAHYQLSGLVQQFRELLLHSNSLERE